MEASYYVLIFIVGLILGSFFNVLIFRFNIGKGVVKGRSECTSCNSIIRWFDLVPVLSYFVLKGRCRRCGAKISPLYPVVEVTTATSFLLLFIRSPLSYSTLLSALIVSLFLLILFFDIRYFIIPDKILVFLAAAVIGLKLISGNANFSHLLISALGLTAFFAILFLVSNGRWIGLGDIKLIFLIGLLLGYPISYVVIISSVWLATAFSIVLLVLKKANMKTEMPFGSFLSVTTIIFIIFSNELQKISKYFY